MNKDPQNSFNLLIGQLLLCLWEYCDMMTRTRVPHDPDAPVLENPWYLTEFATRSVSPSGTHSFLELSRTIAIFRLSSLRLFTTYGIRTKIQTLWYPTSVQPSLAMLA